MKKHLLIMLSIISMHAYAMEMEVKSANPIIDLSVLLTYPTEILDLIAQFLPFHDYETEEEFIERTQAITTKAIPQEYLLVLPFTKIKCSAYSPDNPIIALLEDCHGNLKEGRMCTSDDPSPRLVIINRKNNQKQLDSIGEYCTNYSKIAISHDGNLIATIHSERYTYKQEKVCFKDILTITSLATNKKEFYDIPETDRYRPRKLTIAFNKQGTEIIIHGDGNFLPDVSLNCIDLIHRHKIVPLTVNTPNPNADHQKTLAKYFAQRGICKNLTEQIPHMKYLNNK